MSSYQEWKRKRTEELANGAQVRPTDLLDRANYAADDIAIKRINICEECPSLLKLTHQCKECGCFMKLKVKLEAATCPLDKW